MSRRGQMLLVVLWVMGCMSVAAGTLALRSTHMLRLGQLPLDQLQRKAIAEAGLQQALRLLAQDTADSPSIDTLQEPWATGREASGAVLCEHIRVGQGAFSIGRWDQAVFVPGLIDEERKLNLNAAAPEQLAQLTASVAPGNERPEKIAQAIVDWRDEPEGSVCQGASPSCHNGPFDSVDELRLVPGLTPELFDALQPHVTVYGSGSVNVNTAPSAVLSAIGCDAASVLQERATTPFTSPPPGCIGAAVTSTAFTVEVDTELRGASAPLHLRAIIDRSGHVLSWSLR